jgi:hypothetical protein
MSATHQTPEDIYSECIVSAICPEDHLKEHIDEPPNEIIELIRSQWRGFRAGVMAAVGLHLSIAGKMEAVF